MDTTYEVLHHSATPYGGARSVVIASSPDSHVRSIFGIRERTILWSTDTGNDWSGRNVETYRGELRNSTPICYVADKGLIHVERRSIDGGMVAA